MNTEELVLRDGRFIHRKTTTEETNIGDASELLSKYVPKGVMNIGYVSTVKWGEQSISAHLLINGTKYLCYAILDALKVSLCYRPLFKNEHVDAYANKDKTLAKDIQSKIHGWLFTGEANPSHFLGRKIKLDIPWDANRFGQLIFGIDGTLPSREASVMSKSSVPGVGQAYLGALRNGEIYTIRLTNHFDHGKICMGDRWERSKNQGFYVNNLNYALESYLSDTNNNDLWDSQFANLWSLLPDGTLPYWAKDTTDQEHHRVLGTPRDKSILRSTPTSITSFIGIT